MGILGFAEYLNAKYAGQGDYSAGLGDNSFGKPISAEKTRILKDKLILAYDKVHTDITTLPMYQELNSELSFDPYWKSFQNIINNLAANIEFMTLKEGFTLSTRLLGELNKLRNNLVTKGVERSKMLKMDEGIKHIQDYIWKESKRILNLHDLKGMFIDTPELKGIVDTVVPTWDYGPGKNPTSGLLHKKPKREHAGKMMKRLMEENENEKKGK